MHLIFNNRKPWINQPSTSFALVCEVCESNSYRWLFQAFVNGSKDLFLTNLLILIKVANTTKCNNVNECASCSGKSKQGVLYLVPVVQLQAVPCDITKLSIGSEVSLTGVSVNCGRI